MRYINWFWVAAGLFVAGMIMSIISAVITDTAAFTCWIAGALLTLAGWGTYITAWIKR